MGAVLPVIKMSVGLIPIVPAHGMDMAAKPAVQEHRFCPFPPGTSEQHRFGRTIALQAAVVKNISEGLVLRGGGGCDITVDYIRPGSFRLFPVFGQLGEDYTVFKPGDAAAENEIHISLNVAVPVAMSAECPGPEFTGPLETARLCLFRGKRGGKKSILAADQAAVFKVIPVAVHIQRKCLSCGVAEACVILKGQVSCGEVVGVNPHGCSAEGAS